MVRDRLTLAMIGMCLLLLLAGCRASVARIQHEYILIRTQGNALVVAENDDPLYAQFDQEILGDAYLARLFTVYTSTTEAFGSTNMLHAKPQVLVNPPMIVVDSAQTGILHNITAQYQGEDLEAEMAVGLGHAGRMDLSLMRQDMARVMGAALLELVDVKPAPPGSAAQPRLYDMTTPSLAFWTGFETALDALYAQQNPSLVATLYHTEPLGPGARERLYGYQLVPSNGLRFRFEGDRPTAVLRSRAEAMRTPGVVGAFFYHLLRQTDTFYPQKYLLWFNSFAPEHIPYGKVLLAAARMPHQQEVSVETFLESYTETFPAERATLTSLADQIFGNK
jgi:hypothetical protein